MTVLPAATWLTAWPLSLTWVVRPGVDGMTMSAGMHSAPVAPVGVRPLVSAELSLLWSSLVAPPATISLAFFGTISLTALPLACDAAVVPAKARVTPIVVPLTLVTLSRSLSIRRSSPTAMLVADATVIVNCEAFIVADRVVRSAACTWMSYMSTQARYVPGAE